MKLSKINVSLKLIIWRFSVNSAKILLKLSEVIRTIQINQREVERLDDDDEYFFGVLNQNLPQDQNWASIILAMFSNKLDKLCITNWNYAEYLKKESVETLIEASW